MKKILLFIICIVVTLSLIGCSNLQRNITTPSQAYSEGYNDAVNGQQMDTNISNSNWDALTAQEKDSITTAYQNGYSKGQVVYQQNQTRDAVVGVVKNALIGTGSKSTQNSNSSTKVNSDGSTTTTTNTTSGFINW